MQDIETPFKLWNFPILSRLGESFLRKPPKPWWSEVAYNIQGTPPNMNVNVITFDTWKDPPFSFLISHSVNYTMDAFDKDGNHIGTEGPRTIPKDSDAQFTLDNLEHDTTYKFKLNEIL